MDERRAKANETIHAAGIFAGAIGFLSPLPGADAVVISPLQAAMVLRLSSIYGVKPSEAALKAAAYAALGQLFGKGGARVMTAFLPGLGSVVRAGVAVGVTEAIGRSVVEKLEEEAAL